MSTDTTITVSRDIADRIRTLADREGYKIKPLADRALSLGLAEVEAEIARGRNTEESTGGKSTSAGSSGK